MRLVGSQEWSRENKAIWDTNTVWHPCCSFNNVWFKGFLKRFPPLFFPSCNKPCVSRTLWSGTDDSRQRRFTARSSTEIKMSHSDSWPAGTLKLQLGSFNSAERVCVRMCVWQTKERGSSTWSLSGPVYVCFKSSYGPPCSLPERINLKSIGCWSVSVCCLAGQRTEVIVLVQCACRFKPSSSVTGKPVMIVTEYMENGSLDSFLRVSDNTDKRTTTNTYTHVWCLEWIMRDTLRQLGKNMLGDQGKHIREHLNEVNKVFFFHLHSMQSNQSLSFRSFCQAVQ